MRGERRVTQNTAPLDVQLRRRRGRELNITAHRLGLGAVQGLGGRSELPLELAIPSNEQTLAGPADRYISE